MRNVFLLVILLVFCLVLAQCKSQAPSIPISGPYLGQNPPGLTAVLFAPGIVSTEADELNATFSRDGRELYFSRYQSGRSTLMVAEEVDGIWSEANVAPFSGTFSDVDPFLNIDGTRLYFSSKRALGGSEQPKDADLWYVERMPGSEWGSPIRLAEVSVPGSNDYYTSIDEEGTLYFSRFDSNGVGDLYRSVLSGTIYSEPTILPPPVNSDLDEHDPFIAPDGSFLIFSSNREGGYGENDLYISFRGEDGSWIEPTNMGIEINSAGYDYCPMFSHDGNYLFFTQEIDGNGDIYWVDAAIINELRPD